MKPVAIFQHDPAQGPGILTDFLDRHDIPFRLVRVTEGDALPAHAHGFSGLVILGSTRSVNERLPWILHERDLLEQALLMNLPVLGHCFGAQLLACGLGARVRPNPRPHIGWDTVYATGQASKWFGPHKKFQAFHWHYESFTIPHRAERVLFGNHILNKGFSHGPHLGLQCHLEVTEDSIRAWCAEGRRELQQNTGPTVQNEQDILRDLRLHLPAMRQVAEQVYGNWTDGLTRSRIYALPSRSAVTAFAQ